MDSKDDLENCSICGAELRASNLIHFCGYPYCQKCWDLANTLKEKVKK
ncbi:MAG: hypothetical protein ACTSYF_03610 [Promethearchaeota archaeon]